MTPISKAAIAITTLGAVGGAGAYAGGLFESSKKESVVVKDLVLNKLENEGFEVLNTEKDSEEWGKILTAYTKATDRSFKKKQEANKKQKDLREDCKRALNEKQENSDSYERAKQWCVKKESINKILDRKGKKLLKLTETDSNEKTAWTTKVEALIKDKTKFDSIKGGIQDSKGASDENINILREGCKALNTETVETTANDFSEKLAIAENWCSVTK